MKSIHSRYAEHGNSHGLRPEIGFAAAAVAGFIVWGFLSAALPGHFVLPGTATVFLMFSAGFAILGWRYPDQDQHRVTYADVSGGLMLIGLFAAANIEPDHLVRIIAQD